jgi:hypothetical protein
MKSTDVAINVIICFASHYFHILIHHQYITTTSPISLDDLLFLFGFLFLFLLFLTDAMTKTTRQRKSSYCFLAHWICCILLSVTITVTYMGLADAINHAASTYWYISLIWYYFLLICADFNVVKLTTNIICKSHYKVTLV